MTRSSIDKGKSPFQPTTTIFLPISKVPYSLSSILVPSKSSPVTTDYTYLILDIVCSDYINIVFGGADQFKKLANKCIYINKACHTYFSVTGKIYVMNCYEFQTLFISYLHLLAKYYSLFVQLKFS